MTDNIKCVNTGPGVLLRSDHMIGLLRRVPGWSPNPPSPDDPNMSWLPLAELAAQCGCPLSQVVARIKAHWNCEQLRKGPYWERVVDVQRNGLEFEGKRLRIAEWAKLKDLSITGITTRIAKGMPVDQVLAFAPFKRGYSKTGPNFMKRDDTPPKPLMHYDATAESPVDSVDTDGLPRGLFRINGTIDTFKGHCKRIGISQFTVRSRLRNGVPIKEAFHPHRLPRSDKGQPCPARSSRRWEFPVPTYIGDKANDGKW